ncbi:hypothetical protein NKH73_20550 [Mesorhizobium sp. M0938]|uniref:hypothetical protein n=1 Tax=unclassified Mesorhizobium TaxID=325217 RepID=UPI003334F6C4
MAAVDSGFCSCEQVAVGDLGPVVSTERVGRIVVSPRHFKKDGGLKPGVFPTSHIQASGLSLFRVDHMTTAEIETQSAAIAGNQKPAGALLCKAERVRTISEADTDLRSLCLVDDPVKNDATLPDNPAHAVALRTQYRDSNDDPETLRIQLELIAMFGGLVALQDIVEQDKEQLVV